MSTPNIQLTVEDIYELYRELEDAFVLFRSAEIRIFSVSCKYSPFQTLYGKRLISILYDKASTIMLWYRQ